MLKPSVTFAVCGRFHFHKYLKYLYSKGSLSIFIYSYRINYSFGIPKKKLKNYFLKEYLLYAGATFFKGKKFYSYLIFLHNLWQWQVKHRRLSGNLLHVLIHGNCAAIIKKYKEKGIPVVGEVVNAHPFVQEQILTEEYSRYRLTYNYGEKVFKEKIIKEYKLCDYLLTPSGFIKDSLVKHGIDSNKIKVIPYGLDLPDSVKNVSVIQPDQEIRLLYIGQITFRKGVVYLLKALSLLTQQNIRVRLTLIGVIDQAYKEVIFPYLQSTEITYISHVDNTEVCTQMKAHDLFIMPSLEDGFGVVVSEALSVHLPVIVTKNCGASEIVEHGQDGLIINAFSETDICNAVVASIGYNFTFKIEYADWKQYVNKLADFYIEIVN